MIRSWQKIAISLTTISLTTFSERAFSVQSIGTRRELLRLHTRPVRQTKPRIRCQFHSRALLRAELGQEHFFILPVMNSFLRFFCSGRRWGPGDRGRHLAQGVSAIGTINIIHSDGSLTLRTNRGELVAALRAEGESGVDVIAASGAGRPQCLPQYKVENDAQCVGNNYGHNRPKDRAHAAPFGVAVYIPDEQ